MQTKVFQLAFCAVLITAFSACHSSCKVSSSSSYSSTGGTKGHYTYRENEFRYEVDSIGQFSVENDQVRGLDPGEGLNIQVADSGDSRHYIVTNATGTIETRAADGRGLNAEDRARLGKVLDHLRHRLCFDL